MKQFEVRKCDLGKGLFATRDFQPGEVILQMVGRTISTQQALAKQEKQSDPLQIASDSYIDLEDPGRCANHSCDPNAGVRPDLCLVAIRSIGIGEEICYDYSTTMGDGLWEIDCHCKAADCRGRIRDFCTLPAHVRKRYMDLGIVQDYLARPLQKSVAAGFSLRAARRCVDIRPDAG